LCPLFLFLRRVSAGFAPTDSRMPKGYSNADPGYAFG
jgi:hypothetical protein